MMIIIISNGSSNSSSSLLCFILVFCFFWYSSLCVCVCVWYMYLYPICICIYSNTPNTQTLEHPNARSLVLGVVSHENHGVYRGVLLLLRRGARRESSKRFNLRFWLLCWFDILCPFPVFEFVFPCFYSFLFHFLTFLKWLLTYLLT